MVQKIKIPKTIKTPAESVLLSGEIILDFESLISFFIFEIVPYKTHST